MKNLILKKFFAAIIISAVLCVSCSDDDNSVNYPTDPLSITIKADGTTSNGAKFAPASNDSFYLDYVLYKIVDSHLEVIGCDKSEIKGDVKIYSPINYLGVSYNVRSVEEEAFRENNKITNIHLPDCIQVLGWCAFFKCTNLKSINFPSELSNIHAGCFSRCQNLNEVIFPKNLTSIGGDAFKECGYLGNVIVPASCKKINQNAFSYCSFKNLTIENGVEYIFYRAFSFCKIENLTLPQTLKYRHHQNDDGFSISHEVFYNANINKVTANLSHWTEMEKESFFSGANINNMSIY